MSILKAGTKAPDFTLHSTPDQKISLSNFKGRPVILVFYPADWSPVCSDQLSLYNELIPEFHKYNAELLAISVDGPWCHLAFDRDRKFQFPLLSTLNRKAKYQQNMELITIALACLKGTVCHRPARHYRMERTLSDGYQSGAPMAS